MISYSKLNSFSIEKCLFLFQFAICISHSIECYIRQKLGHSLSYLCSLCMCTIGEIV